MGAARMSQASILPTFLNGRVSVLVGDITQQQVDAVVNAANSTLLGGGGVDGAIHRAGGPDIVAACRELRRTRYPDGLPTGEAVITTAGRMPAQHVIHTVGPVYGAAGEQAADLLAACYRNALLLAVQHTLTTLAFPAISTGVYGYPREEAAAVASRAMADLLAATASLKEIHLVFFARQDADIFITHQIFPAFPAFPAFPVA